MSSNNWNNQRVIMLGAGREGQATVSYLQHKYPQCQITLADQQAIDLSIDGIETLFGDDYPKSLENWDTVILSPIIPPHTTLLTTAKHIATPTNIFFEDCVGTIIAVTGSKGKSTTSSLLHAMLQAGNLPVHLVGNIGNAGLQELQHHNDTSDIFVFELSSYQSSRLTTGPEFAMVTSLFPDHLDYHGSLEQYYTDKLTVTRLQTAEQRIAYNADNTELQARVSSFSGKAMPWPDSDGAHVEKDTVMIGAKAIIATKEIPLLGEHNVSNVLGAITVAAELGVSPNAIEQAIRDFSPLPHRLEPIGTFNDIIFVNDSIATVPEAAIAALNAIDNVGTILLGGTDRGYEWEELVSTLKKHDIQNVVLFPDSGRNMQASFTAAGYEPNLLTSDSMADAVRFAYKYTPANSVCLLSPGSPSFTMFKNFEERGHVFAAEVEKQSR